MNTQTLEYKELPITLDGHFADAPTDVQLATADDFLMSPTWELEADRKLAALTSFPRGWDGQGAGSISRAMASYIRSILTSVMCADTPVPSFVPAHGGAVQIEWHRGGLDIELMIYRLYDAELTVYYHDGRDSIEDEPLSSEFRLLGEALAELG